jgi:hypothetical protein
MYIYNNNHIILNEVYRMNNFCVSTAILPLLYSLNILSKYSFNINKHCNRCEPSMVNTVDLVYIGTRVIFTFQQ